jgi:hypothetical protein
LNTAKRILSVLLFAAYGFITGAWLGGTATFYVYFIGLWFGAPLGAVLGASVGWRAPLRDACLVFFGALCGLHIVTWLVNRNGPTGSIAWDSFGTHLVAWLGFVLGGAFLLLGSRQFLSISTRRDIAIPLAVFWSVYFLAYLYQLLYVWEW